MASARPLHELLADLVGDADARPAHGEAPEAYLAAHGHPDLPPELVAEAVVSYADTAPADVAEHLAPFVMSHSGVPGIQDIQDIQGAEAGSDWFDLLTSAPLPAVQDGELAEDPRLDDLPATDDPWSGENLGPDPAALDFGTGSFAPVAAPDAGPVGTPDEPAAAGLPDDLEPTGETDWSVVEPERASVDTMSDDQADADTEDPLD